MKLSTVARYLLCSAFVAVGSGFQIYKVLPEFHPEAMSYPSIGRDANCTAIYRVEDVKRYHNSAFDCTGKRDREEICNCVSPHLSKLTAQASRGPDFVNVCGTCQMGIVPINDHYEQFQSIAFWKQIMVILTNLSADRYAQFNGLYRLIVLPTGSDKVMTDVFKDMADEVQSVLSRKGGQGQLKGEWLNFMTRLMAEMAPHVQELSNGLEGYFDVFPVDLKSVCGPILSHWKALANQNMDAFACLADGTIKVYGGRPFYSTNARTKCDALRTSARVFSTFGSKQMASAVPTCIITNMWEEYEH